MALLYKSEPFYKASLPPFVVMMVVTYTVPITPECPATCVPIGLVVPAVSAVPLEAGAIVSKILTVLVDVTPVVLDVLGHLSEALGTCTGDPERYSH